MTHTTVRTALLLLMRDVRGRFLRLRRPTAQAMPRRRRARRQPVIAAVQLALF